MVNEIPIISIVSDEVRIHLVRSAAVYAIHKEIGDRRGEGEGAEEKGETFVQNYYLYGYDNNKCKLKTIEGRTKNEGAVAFLQCVLVETVIAREGELHLTPVFIIYFF